MNNRYHFDRCTVAVGGALTTFGEFMECVCVGERDKDKEV